MPYDNKGGGVGWRGADDGTPASSTKVGPADYPESPQPKGDDWKGMPDSTPASRPTDPDKE